jgi:hypothetical protein
MEVGNRKLDGRLQSRKEEMARRFRVRTSQKTSALQWVGEASFIEEFQPTIRIKVQGKSTIFLRDEQ